jgi:hypothetical protein
MEDWQLPSYFVRRLPPNFLVLIHGEKIEAWIDLGLSKNRACKYGHQRRETILHN